MQTEAPCFDIRQSVDALHEYNSRCVKAAGRSWCAFSSGSGHIHQTVNTCLVLTLVACRTLIVWSPIEAECRVRGSWTDHKDVLVCVVCGQLPILSRVDVTLRVSVLNHAAPSKNVTTGEALLKLVLSLQES